MNKWDMLAALASGVGQGAANKQQQELVMQDKQAQLRQQALENALRRQQLDMQKAELDEQRRHALAVESAARSEADAKVKQMQDALNAMVAGPAAYVAKNIPQVPTGDSKLLPQALQALGAKDVTLPEASVPQMQPTSALPLQDILNLGVQEGWLEQGAFNPTLGAYSWEQKSAMDRAQEQATLRQTQAGATSAGVKAGVDVATADAQITTANENAKRAGYTALGAYYDNLIAELKDIPQATVDGAEAKIKAQFIADYAESLYNAQVKNLRAGFAADDKTILTEKAAEEFAAKHNGMRPEIYATIMGISLNQERLGLSWKQYTEPIPTPPAPPRPGSLTQVESSAIAQANKIIAQIGAGKKDPETGAKEIEALPAFPTQKQLAGQARTTKSTSGSGTRWWQSFVPSGVKPQGQ